MKHVFRSLFGCCLVLVFWASAMSDAQALLPKATQYFVLINPLKQTGSPLAPRDPTMVGACQAAVAAANPLQTNTVHTYLQVVGSSCQYRTNNKTTGAVVIGTNSTDIYSDPAACPANSAVSGTQCQCNTGYDEAGGQCVAHVNACTGNAGKPTTVRVTIGYTRTPDDNDTKTVGPVFNPWAGGSVCSGGCTMDFASVEKAWISQAPTAGGLYRNSVDAKYVNSGNECTASASNAGDMAVKTDAPIPDCPGYVGEVNGTPGCYGTAAKPVVPANKPAGAAPPPVAGNPPAGVVPSSGAGSAADPTPATGNGGPAGGPAGAAVGGKGGSAGGTSDGKGTTDKPADGKEQAACGAPGQPVCAVKVDEKGTPENAGTSFDAAQKKSDDSYAAQAKTVTDASASTYKPTWDFSFALPTGCTAFDTEIEGFKLDPCRYQSTIHDLMSLVWAAITVFTIIGMVGRTIRGT